MTEHTTVKRHSRKTKKGKIIVRQHSRKLKRKLPYKEKSQISYLDHIPRVSDISGNKQYAFFHSMNTNTLDKIYDANRDSNNKDMLLVAPSIGITKQDSMLTKFGRIIFVADKKTLTKNDMYIFERDIWAPRVSSVPHGISSPESVSEYMKDEYGGVENWRGHDGFMEGYAHASKDIPMYKLDEVANKLLRSSDIYHGTSTEMQKELAGKIRGSISGYDSYKKSGALVGELARIYDNDPTSKEIVDIIKKHDADPSEFFNTFNSEDSFREFHKSTYKWFRNIPSEYMEAKTFNTVPINDFPKVLVPQDDKESLSLLKKMNYKGKIIQYKG